MGAPQFSDFLYMHQLAASLASGDGFTIEGVRIFNQSVGYPAFLAPFYAIFGAREVVALVLNCLLGGLSAGLVCMLVFAMLDARGAIGRRTVDVLALLAGGVATVYPDSWLYCGLIASENLLVPLLLVMVLLNGSRSSEEEESRRTAIMGGVGTGILAAVAASVKANVLIYCIFLGLQWLLSGRRWIIRASCAALAGVILLVPWTVANYRASGGHIIPFSAVAGTVILDGTNPSASGKPTNQYHLECEKSGSYSEIELNQLRLKQAVSYIKADPPWYAGLVLRKLIHSISPVRDFVYEHDGHCRLFQPFVSRWYPTAFNAFLLVGCVLGLILSRGQRRLLLSSLALCMGALVLQAIFCAYSRYRFPFLFALVPTATYGWSCVVIWMGRGKALQGEGSDT